MPKIPYVDKQSEIDFVTSIIRKKIIATGLPNTAACKNLSPELDISYATLLNAFKGKFTYRTIHRMVDAGWFTRIEFRTAGTAQKRTPRTSQAKKARAANDRAQQREREKAAFKRGFSRGKNEGFLAGVLYEKNNSNEYTRGYNDGLRDSRGVRRSKTSTSFPSSLPMDRLNKLFQLNTKQGSTTGEIAAARKAAGITLSKWIKNQFGEDVTISMS